MIVKGETQAHVAGALAPLVELVGCCVEAFGRGPLRLGKHGTNDPLDAGSLRVLPLVGKVNVFEMGAGSFYAAIRHYFAQLVSRKGVGHGRGLIVLVADGMDLAKSACKIRFGHPVQGRELQPDRNVRLRPQRTRQSWQSCCGECEEITPAEHYRFILICLTGLAKNAVKLRSYSFRLRGTLPGE